MAYSSYYDSNVWSQILPGLRQYEATTGRNVGDPALRGLFRGALDVQAQRGERQRQLNQEQQRLQLEQEQADALKHGQILSGGVQLGTSAVTLGLLARGGLFRPRPGIGGVGGGGTPLTSTAPGLTSFSPAPGATLDPSLNVGSTGATSASLPGAISPAAGAGTEGTTAASGGIGLADVGAGLGTGLAGFGAGYGISRLKGLSPGLRYGLGAGVGAGVGALAGTFIFPGIGTGLGALLGGIGGLGGGGKH